MSIFKDSKVLLTPNGYKDGKLYAIKGSDATLVRATTFTRENASGVTETMSANVPLIDYSGSGNCPVINIVIEDTYTIAIPSDANRVTYYNEDGTITQLAVTPSTDYTPVVGRYKAISVDYGISPPTNNIDVEGLDFNAIGIITKSDFESALGVTCGAFERTTTRIQAEILTNPSQELDLRYFSLTAVNYISLADLQGLYLSNNQLTAFNPSKPLAITLQLLLLGTNLITTAGYTQAETWANIQPAFINPCTINFNGNTDSVAGTNLETILLTKNATVVV